MKKILLIIAVVLCVAVAGTALATTVYYNAQNVSGSVTADTYVELSLDGSSDLDEIALVPGQPVIYKISCGVTTSATNEANGTLTVTTTAATGDYNLTGVTVALYTDSACTTAALNDSSEPISIIGAGSFAVEDIDESTNYWAKVTFAGAANEAALAQVNGTMRIEFEQE